MTQAGPAGAGDRLSVSFHGYAHTHLDAFAHRFFDGKMWNGFSERVAEIAAARKRWEFLLTAAPLPVRNGTGSPMNPIAVF